MTRFCTATLSSFSINAKVFCTLLSSSISFLLKVWKKVKDISIKLLNEKGKFVTKAHSSLENRGSLEHPCSFINSHHLIISLGISDNQQQTMLCHKIHVKILTCSIILQYAIKTQKRLLTYRAGKNPRSTALGKYNVDLGQVKIEVWWPSGQVKLASVVL